MSPLAAELLKDFGGVVLGWVLGLGTALLTEWWKERRQIRDTKRAIAAELREVAYRLLALIYLTEMKVGALDRKLLEWLHPQIERYMGLNPKQGILASVADLLKRSDAELAQFAAHQRSTEEPGQFQPRLEASYTTAAAAQAHDFEPDDAVRVFDVLAHIRMFDDVRETVVFYQHLTFTPGVSDENHAIAVRNADLALQQLAKRARIIVDKITALGERYPL